MWCDVVSVSRGIPTVPGTVTLKKDTQNLIGISIGGGAQFCPCLYIVQVTLLLSQPMGMFCICMFLEIDFVKCTIATSK